jgi:hypothetical protein
MRTLVTLKIGLAIKLARISTLVTVETGLTVELVRIRTLVVLEVGLTKGRRRRRGRREASAN